jgi:hypothetical protein
VDNIKMDLRPIGWGAMDWTDRLRRPVEEDSHEHSNEALGSIKYWDVLE